MRQDSLWLKDRLKEVTGKVTNLAGLAQDAAAVCKAAFRKLHSEMPLEQRRRCFEIVCGEHQSQLLNQDIAKALPWLKDRRLVESFSKASQKGSGLSYKVKKDNPKSLF